MDLWILIIAMGWIGVVLLAIGLARAAGAGDRNADEQIEEVLERWLAEDDPGRDRDSA